MSRKFNKERFEVVINIVYTFLRFSVVALYVLIAFIGIAWVVTWFIPQSVFDFNLANLEQTHVNVLGLDYDLAALGLSGIVNVKSIVVLGLFALIANIGFYQYVQVLLKKTMKQISENQPFTQTNVKYLQWMGIGYLVAAVVLPVVNSLFFTRVINLLELFELGVSLSPNLQAVFMGIIILIVAYIFDYGSYLQEEHDMTV